MLDLLSNFSGIPALVLVRSKPPVAVAKKRTKPLTDEERFSIIQLYDFMTKDQGKTPRGFWLKIAEHFRSSTRLSMLC